jgi:ankyrin repeat protein
MFERFLKEVDEKGNSLLHYACMNDCDLNIIFFLLEKG